MKIVLPSANFPTSDLIWKGKSFLEQLKIQGHYPEVSSIDCSDGRRPLINITIFLCEICNSTYWRIFPLIRICFSVPVVIMCSQMIFDVKPITLTLYSGIHLSFRFGIVCNVWKWLALAKSRAGIGEQNNCWFLSGVTLLMIE